MNERRKGEKRAVNGDAKQCVGEETMNRWEGGKKDWGPKAALGIRILRGAINHLSLAG